MKSSPFLRLVRGWRWLLLVLTIGLSLSVMDWPEIGAQLKSVALDSFPIRYVRVEGDIRYTGSEDFIDAVSVAFVGQSYFSVSLSDVVVAARAVPWIDSVEVERVWPDTVVLRVREHFPVARWGDRQLMDARGERFSPANVESFSRLPHLQAPIGSERELLKTLIALNDQLKGEGVEVVSLARNERRAWVAGLSNDAELIFGRQEPVSAFRYFMALSQKLAGRKLVDMRRLDLRYPNGFSVVWRNSSETPPVLPAALGI